MTAPEDADAPPPAISKIRARIAEEAARILAAGGDSERARYRAARRVARGWVPPDQIPAHDEVRRELLRTQAPSHASAAPGGDRLERLAALVAPLALVRPDPAQHPAEDALGQALRTFALVAEERPFDEELLTAALVHDVGVAIDRRAAVAAGLAALAGLVTERTCWLIENLPAARAYRSGTLGYRARRRLEGHEDFLDLLLLADADRRARSCGRAAGTLDDAVATLRALADPD